MEVRSKSERRMSDFYCHMHLEAKTRILFVTPLPSMSLDTMVDNPGVLSDQTLMARSQMVHGQQKKEKRNGKKQIVQVSSQTPIHQNKKGDKKAFEICVQMMREKGRCNTKSGCRLNSTKWRRGKGEKIHKSHEVTEDEAIVSERDKLFTACSHPAAQSSAAAAARSGPCASCRTGSGKQSGARRPSP